MPSRTTKKPSVPPQKGGVPKSAVAVQVREITRPPPRSGAVASSLTLTPLRHRLPGAFPLDRTEPTPSATAGQQDRQHSRFDQPAATHSSNTSGGVAVTSSHLPSGSTNELSKNRPTALRSLDKPERLERKRMSSFRESQDLRQPQQHRHPQNQSSRRHSRTLDLANDANPADFPNSRSAVHAKPPLLPPASRCNSLSNNIMSPNELLSYAEAYPSSSTLNPAETRRILGLPEPEVDGERKGTVVGRVVLNIIQSPDGHFSVAPAG